MAGETQRKPVAVRILGLRPGQVPYIEIDYEDGRDTVQRLLDDPEDPETQRLLVDAFGGERMS